MDMLAGDSAWLNEDYNACDDEDLQWTNAATDKQRGIIGTAYSCAAFGDILNAPPHPVSPFATVRMIVTHP